MIKNEANKTKPVVRLIVISAAILLLLSTFAMYMGMIMGANDDSSITQEQYQKMYEEGRETYEKMCGPLNHMSRTEGPYKWLDDPWPWEYAKNREV